MMRYLPVLTDRHGVFAWQAFIDWWTDLRDETEYMPNTSFRELDFIAEADLYQECKSDLLESGTHHSMVGSLQLWKKVWKGHFGDVKIRKHRRVDGKDRKRAFLRYLLRRKVTRSRRDRLLIKELRSIYRDTCRRERTFYWVHAFCQARTLRTMRRTSAMVRHSPTILYRKFLVSVWAVKLGSSSSATFGMGTACTSTL